MDLLLGALFRGNIVHKPDNRGATTADGAGSVDADLDHGAIPAHGGERVVGVCHFPFDPLSHVLHHHAPVLLGDHQYRVAPDQFSGGIVAENLEKARIHVGESAVLDDAIAGNRLLDQAAELLFR
jgi:hypothetical protein